MDIKRIIARHDRVLKRLNTNCSIILGQDDLETIIEEILNKDSILLETKNTVELHQISYKGNELVLEYNVPNQYITNMSHSSRLSKNKDGQFYIEHNKVVFEEIRPNENLRQFLLKEMDIQISQEEYFSLVKEIEKGELEEIMVENKEPLYKMTLQGYEVITKFSPTKRKIVSIYSPFNFNVNEVGKWTRKSKVFNRRKNHAKERAMERFGISLNERKYHIANQAILNNQAKELRVQEDDTIFYLLEIEGNEYIALFKPDTKGIVTFYHNQWLIQDEEGEWQLNRKMKTKKKKERGKVHSKEKSIRKAVKSFKNKKRKTKIKSISQDMDDYTSYMTNFKGF